MTDIDDVQSAAAKQARLALVLPALLLVVIIYGALAYLVLPAIWTHHEHQKGLADLAMVTRTAQGIPGDPINVGLIGNEKDVLCAMNEAGWFPADPVTLKSSIEIAGRVIMFTVPREPRSTDRWATVSLSGASTTVTKS